MKKKQLERGKTGAYRGPLLRNVHIGQLWFGRHCVWIESQSWPDLMQSKISNQELKRHYIRCSWDFYVCTYFRSTAPQFSCFLSPTIPKPRTSSFQCRILSVTEVLCLPDPCISSFHRSTALDYDTRSLFKCLHLWLHSMHHQTLLGQWLNFKLFGITYLVGKKKFKLFFSGSIGWVRNNVILKSSYLWEMINCHNYFFQLGWWLLTTDRSWKSPCLFPLGIC